LRERVKRAVAFAAIAFCILTVSSAFIAFYGQVFQPPPLLNTNMKYWTIDPTKNLLTPYLWTIDVIEGPSDNISVYQTVVADRAAIAADGRLAQRGGNRFGRHAEGIGQRVTR
jgi:hypothetical protein